MGQMIDGVWESLDRKITAEDGSFVRPTTRFRGTIPAVVPGRYHLYVLPRLPLGASHPDLSPG